jgi:alkylation response protein AidB-like acyl-CoA dehydrogenase
MVTTELLTATGEHKALRETLRAFLTARSPLSAVRELADRPEGFDRDVWQQLAGQIGLHGMAIPEQYGGLGQGPVETALVFSELGRALYPGPFLATIGLAVPALLHSGDTDACAELLPGIAAGQTIAALAVAESDGRWDAARQRGTVARRAGGSWTVSGQKSFILDGAAADLLLLTAQTAAGSGLFAVTAGAPGMTTMPLAGLDLTRRLAAVTLDNVPARLLGECGQAEDIIAAVYDQALVAVAAEQSGGAARCLELTVAYAKEREQFGVPIGSFQAIAHKCVDMLHESQFADSAVAYAAACDAAGSAEFPLAVRVAAAYCARAYRRVTTEMIQVHGGTGFTWEHDAHLYYRRAWSSQQLFGDPSAQFEVIAQRAGL